MFDLRNAKCTLETDRVSIERQVVNLFEETWDDDDPIVLAFKIDIEGSLVLFVW